MRLRVTRRAATQIAKALDYIEADSPKGQTMFASGFKLFSACWRSTLTRGKRPTYQACDASLSALIRI